MNENVGDETLINDEELQDRCFECGSLDLRFDKIEWESCCMNCGLVGVYERWDIMDTYFKPKTYFKHNYFTNSILPKAMEKGFKVGRMDMFEMERLYKECVSRFYATQSIHKRKYMLNSTFTFVKICEKLGKDVRPFVSLPKKDTVLKLEKDWLILNVF